MKPNDLLLDAFSRVQQSVSATLARVRTEDLLWRPDADANPVGWLVWHLARVQDDHLSGLAGRGQVWVEDGWFERFGLPYPVRDLGYGQSSEQVGQFGVTDSELLGGYYAAVGAQTNLIVSELDDAGFDAIVDEAWDPPVTAAVRLVSVVNDVAQHAGQAAYVAGLAARR